MLPGRYWGAMGLSLLLAMPVAAQTPSPPKSPSSPAATAPSPTEKTTGKSEQGGGLIDINSASAEELDKLPGVGPARAQAIISHRPYHGKDDLTNRKIIPENVYNEIKDKIIARQGPTK
jgi:competence protein ComEA